MQCSGDQGFSVRDSFQPEADASIRESPSHVSAAASPYEPRPPSGGSLLPPLLPRCHPRICRSIVWERRIAAIGVMPAMQDDPN